MSTLTRGELNDLLAGFAAKNPKYRAALVKDPKDVIQKQLCSDLPESLTVKVVQDTPDTMHIVLPHFHAEGEKLSDAALESVAGGFIDTYTCNFNKSGMGAIGTRVELSLV